MEFANGKDDIPYMMENEKCVQTTNQILFDKWRCPKQSWGHP